MIRRSPPKNRSDFDLAIICALQLEADAAEALFDHFWEADGDRYGKAFGDHNAYRIGVIGNHHAVLAYMPGIGKAKAASVAASLRSSFPGIRLALIVGICGGVPGGSDQEVFLGDIIVGDEIVTYDFGRKFPRSFRRKETRTESGQNWEVRAFLQKLKGYKGREHLLRRTRRHLTVLQRRTQDYSCPGRALDRLFQPTYDHKHHGSSRCRTCKKDGHCKKAQEATCDLLKCDWEKLVPRSRSVPGGIESIDVHFGRIASGDTVMRSGMDRDRIAAEENVIAFDMEGAGICSNLPCIVVKGVSDYADSHKDKVWQKYAAGTAAACMKALLEQWATTDRSQGSEEASGQSVSDSTYNASEVASDPRPPWEEGSVSPADQDISDPDLSQVRSTIESGFKNVLVCFKRYRKYLPQDADLKRIVKTQRVIFSSYVEIMSSDALGPPNDRLDSSTSDCMNIIRAIGTKLGEIEQITMRLPVSAKAKEQPQNGIDILRDAVEDLKSLVQVFESTVRQRKVPRRWEKSTVTRTPRGRREFQDFRIVQQAACSLYDAFGTACNAHALHNVHLSLQPNWNGTLTRIRFHLAFVPNGRTPGKEIWMNVESTIKSSSSPVSTSSAGAPSSLKRSHDGEDASHPQTLRKRVQFQLVPRPFQSSCPPEPMNPIPNLYLQRNFCRVIERSLRQPDYHGCIGLLADNDICQHLAYMDRQTNHPTTYSSLSQLISMSATDSTRTMSLYERVRLARCLATAVLYYHATPWLNSTWRSDDVYFFEEPNSLLQQIPHALPYMATSIRASDSMAPPQAPSSDYHHIIRNPVLFGLGIMFLELAYQAPLRSLQQPADLQKGKTPGFADYFTAHRLVDQSYRMVSKGFQNIIKRCLHCDFGHDNDFANPALQEAFYHKVISGLESLERLFEELQLDGPELVTECR
ncbi:hypothetical protein DTO271G3_2167 [Paecilomyces variotii]|nr:hypothetical protein DTO271G3_2167 [Paecilomyces variotii]